MEVEITLVRPSIVLVTFLPTCRSTLLANFHQSEDQENIFSFFFLFFLNRNKASEVNDFEWNCVLDQGWKCFALLAGYSKAADGQPGRHSKHSQATSERLFCIITLPNGC
jgi:hypothetical protein